MDPSPTPPADPAPLRDEPAATPPERSRKGVRAVAFVGLTAALTALIWSRFGSEAPTQPPTNDSATAATSPVAVSKFAVPDPPSKISERDLAGLKFTDVAATAGLDAPQATSRRIREQSMTSAVAVTDLEGDGDDDIFLSRFGLPDLLYRNNGDGTFTDIAATAGLVAPDRTTPDSTTPDSTTPDSTAQNNTTPGSTPPGSPGTGSAAATFADVDADGCVDLYVAGDATALDRLYMNDCSGRFTDQAAERGIDRTPPNAELGSQIHGVTFDDVDRDGDLDLLVLHWDPAMLGGQGASNAASAGKLTGTQCEIMAAIRENGLDRAVRAGPNRSRMYLNDGAGRFADATAQLGLPLHEIAAFTAQFVDIDDDGWNDLFVTGDFCTSRLFRNEAGQRFTDITEAAGVGTDENGMGSVVTDINGDGRPDWFITSIRCAATFGNTGCSGNRLYVNQGDGTFDDATDDYGVRHGWWGWGAAIEDFGNDGRLQIAQTNGFAAEEIDQAYAFATDPLRLWARGVDDDGPFVDAADESGFTSTAVGHGLVPFDFDNDGDLDILVANAFDPPQLFRNDRPRKRSWLRVRLDDGTQPGNRSGLGAKVVVRRDGADPVTGWILSSGSYESHKPAEFHVGFGEQKSDLRVDVDVWWPGETSPQRERDVRTDRVVVIRRR